MNLSRYLRFSITKLVRGWKQAKKELCAEIRFILAPLDGKRNHAANNRRNGTKDKSGAPQADKSFNRSATDLIPTKNNQSEGYDKPHTDRENVKFLLECFGIIGGIVGVYYLIAQYQEMVNATKLGTAQLEETRRAFRTDARAWVAPFEMIAGPAETNTVVFKLKFKNTGRTPALNVTVWHDTSYGFGSDLPQRTQTQTNSILLAPDAITYVRTRQGADILDHIKHFGMDFTIFGQIDYDDIFGEHHWTKFCWNFDSELNGKPSPVLNSSDDAKGGNKK